MKHDGKKISFHIANDAEYRDVLNRKLQEEVAEFCHTPKRKNLLIFLKWCMR